MATRPISRDDIAAYKLASTMELTGGLNTVGLGQAVHLEAEVDISVPPLQIASVTWSLASKPAGSNAALADSPLGTNVPVYPPSDALIYQIAGRKMLRPDVAGIYNVNATITTGSGVATVSVMLTASSYMGISACSLCHSNGPAGTAWSMMNGWAKTLHSEVFKDNINGANGTTYASSCWGCHTVGDDANASVPNGGFNFVQTQLGWTPPGVMQPGNWDAVPKALQNVANIQCENCHGPGSTHVMSGGDPRLISKTVSAGTCVQCHSAASHHIKGKEWGNSLHAITTSDPAGNASCVGCHTHNGFVDRINGVGPVDLSYDAISCQTCHEPHGETMPNAKAPNAHLVRTLNAATLADGTQITMGGTGVLCMNCHQSRQNAMVYAAKTAGSAHFGPHEGPQADMLAGANGFTYDKHIPSSAHGDVVVDTCVTCHTQAPAATDPSLGLVGGHTFKMSYAGSAGIPAVQMVGACQTCHGPDVTTFNFPLMDYNDDGVIEGCQTEVQHLLDELALMLPPVGQAKSSLTIDSTWTQPQLKAAYNYLFVQKDGSLGIHNMAYTVGLLKASIADMKANSK